MTLILLDFPAVRSAGCKCLPFLLVKSAREVPAFRFFPEKDKEEEVSSVFTCNVKCIMAFLLRERKDVLLEVAKELRVEIDITLPKIEFKKRICQSEDYNEESVKSLLEGILAEKQEARELKERQEARELKERQEARELKERQGTREYELERLRLSNATETVSVSSADLEGQGVNRRVNLKDLVPKFDAKNADINLFFEIFERQVIKEKVVEDRWVSQLIPLLPIEIAEIVAKEPLEKSDDYPHIKNLLLARFQLTPIALRDRFESHQRRPGAMWADLVFELRSYLDNWLAGMKVGDFAALKELLVTEQIKKKKKRAPSELVDHFLDSWDGFKEAKSLAEKLDHFEAIRRVHKKTGPTKTWERRTFDKQPLESKNKSAHFSGKGKNIGPLNRDPYKHERRGEFVKTCDSCQRVGKPRDKAKAPLKLVPIISEVFSKINIDAVGPLPVSTKQNRYLITSICVASKYPEAIPVESITSPNVIDALLSIFSRIGFPREIQSDLGTSFTSELTTTFFNKFGIKVTRSSVSHPQSNAVERVHRTIKRVIKALCVESGEDWEGFFLWHYSLSERLRTRVQVSVPPSWSWERI
ncbi:retrovirus-related Pol polyprotein from transposon 412 [Trichonephila clavipes]|uniref:Retrovirus-related Pol polyprotein from transposon 412 n=1 Tax=Trichonephila clavipes TaxID=2585209 RepID=A0A8X6VD41_TRICX|nr:retrovirus-related Pol polyprotein from transposon 412 [Trichonephila clavipes]